MNDDDLQVLTTYANSVEASFAQQILEEDGIPARLGAEAAATWLSYYGAAVGGVRLLVRRGDMQAAAQLLRELDHSEAPEAFEWPEGVDDDTDQSETVGPSEASPELVRAFRAAIIGIVLAPLGLPFYSLYLIVRHQLFLPDRGGSDWRFYVAMIANTWGVYFAKIVWTV